MNKDNNIVVLLTGTIDPKDMVSVTVSDPVVRLEQYRASIRKWLKSDTISKIIFCENSGYDLSRIKKDIEESGLEHKIEILQFNGQNFDKRFGKSYGEMLIMDYVAKNSKWFSKADYVVKVTGRYFIKNISKIVMPLKSSKNIFVMTDLRANLTSAECRVFAFKPEFFEKYYLKVAPKINELKGLTFEHAIARAIHNSIGDGNNWEMLPVAPIIEGQSGSTGKIYATNPLSVCVKQFFYSFRKWFVTW